MVAATTRKCRTTVQKSMIQKLSHEEKFQFKADVGIATMIFDFSIYTTMINDFYDFDWF